MTLISSAAALCIHQRTIPGATNENGAMPELIDEVLRIYGRSLDGPDVHNRCRKHVTGRRYQACRPRLCLLHAIQGRARQALYREATRALGRRTETEADQTSTDKQKGCIVTYHAFVYDLEGAGWLDWTHARQIVRVQRIVEDPKTGEIKAGNRYYVSSKTPKQLSAMSCLQISRGHSPGRE